jgi:hypothetical protein
MGRIAPKTASAPDNPAPTGFWQRHGNTAQWASVCIAAVAALVSISAIGLTIYWHSAASASANADEHVERLISKHLEPINQRLDHLAEQVNDALGQLKRIDEEIQRRRSINEKPLLSKSATPNQILAAIRTKLRAAEKTKTALPDAALINYRKTVQALPNSEKDYWTTVAAIINYQSFLNRTFGNAPDPAKVSHPCLGLTAGSGSDNVIQGYRIAHCVVDLDTTHNVLEDLVIRDSVVRYHGGPVALRNVVFVNCSFVLDPANFPNNPAQPGLLLSLLDSDQKQIKLSTHS